MLHLGAAPVEGLALSDLFGEAFAAALLGRLGRRKVHIARAQATIVVGTGEEKVIGYSVTPLRQSRGGHSWILLFRDITDAQRLGSEMRRLDRLVSLGEISANVAHELKNPLTVMYANMEWLLEKLPQEFRRRVQITIDHMERMEAIIARMGILSKDQPLEARPIDLGDLVAQMLAFVEKTLREKRIDVAVAVPPAPLWVQGDPAQLQQVLLNIIMNAGQAIGSNGTLAVRLDRRAHGRAPGMRTRRRGQRTRHSAPPARQDLRAVFHDQGDRDRPRALHHEPDRRRAQGPDPGGEPPRGRGLRQNLVSRGQAAAG